MLEGSRRPIDGRRVLIVDDEPDMRALARFALELNGSWTVAGEACDGMAAICLAAELQPDVVLLDLEMPWLDGAESVPHIRRRSPNALIVVWTSHPHGPRAASALELGAHAVIGKGDTPANRLGDWLVEAMSERPALERSGAASPSEPAPAAAVAPTRYASAHPD